MAAQVDPRHVAARHQSMHHFVASAPWEAAAVLRVARDWVLAPMARHGPVAAWIVDDTAFPKKGQHSVGVARQYCGVLGKPENCQVAVSVSAANDAVSVPVAYALYLPETWAHDRTRRRRAGVPPAVTFRTKWQMALAHILALQAEGLPPAPVGADAAYGDVTQFRDRLTTARMAYVVGVKAETTVWRPGPSAVAPEAVRGAGPSPHVCPAHRIASAPEPEAAGHRTARLGVARRPVARRHTGDDARPLRAAPRPAGPSR